jgi:hypothetical protein
MISRRFVFLMGKKSGADHSSLSEGKLGFAASHNNSWYLSSDSGERKDVLRTGRFPPLPTPFKRPPSLLDSFDKTRDTAKTGERYAYMASCNDILHRDYPLRYSIRSARDSGSCDVLPTPTYAHRADRTGRQNPQKFTLPLSEPVIITKGAPQNGCVNTDRFTVRAL